MTTVIARQGVINELTPKYNVKINVVFIIVAIISSVSIFLYTNTHSDKIFSFQVLQARESAAAAYSQGQHANDFTRASVLDLGAIIYRSDGTTLTIPNFDQSTVMIWMAVKDVNMIRDGNKIAFQNEINSSSLYHGEFNSVDGTRFWLDQPVHRRTLAVAGILMFGTSEEQLTADSWGLTSADFEKFPIK